MKIGIDLQKNQSDVLEIKIIVLKKHTKCCICKVELKRQFVNEARSEDLIQNAAQGINRLVI